MKVHFVKELFVNMLDKRTYKKQAEKPIISTFDI